MKILTTHICFLIFIANIYGNTRQDTHEQLLEKIHNVWQLPTNTNVDGQSTPTSLTITDTSIDLNKIILPKIHFDNLPLSQAIKLLSDLTEAYDIHNYKLNFILLDPRHLNPTVDLNVQQMTLNKVLYFISQATNFSFRVEENNIIFQSDNDINLPEETRFFPIARGIVLQILQYSPLQEGANTPSEETQLKAFFSKIGIPFNETSGFAYDGTRLIVTHKPLYLNRIERVLKSYQDIYQVVIEAKFLEVQQQTLDELNLRWNSSTKTNLQFDTHPSLRTLADLQNSIQKAAPQIPNHLVQPLTTPLINFTSILNGYQMGCMMRFLEQKADSDLMSAPKITVLSGCKADIVVAQELRYPQSYRDSHSEVGFNNCSNRLASSAGTSLMSGTPENFTTRNIGVEMTVLPIVENNRRISLKLEPSVTEFEGYVEYGGYNVVTSGNTFKEYSSGYYQPVFSTRRISTEVTLENGSTVVMGGLTREEIKDVKDRIPFFGDIPLIGKLFRSKSQSTQKRNLLIFVTAQLLDSKGRAVQPNEQL